MTLAEARKRIPPRIESACPHCGSEEIYAPIGLMISSDVRKFECERCGARFRWPDKKELPVRGYGDDAR